MWLHQRLEQNKLTLTPDQCAQMICLLHQLQTWNQIHNLTAIRDPKIMLDRHIIESLILFKYMDRVKHSQNLRRLDIGTGPGFPGLVLALMQPNSHWTLLDANGKKLSFVRHMVYQLQLTHVEVVQARIERFLPKEGYDQIVTRAFSHAQNIVNVAAPLLAPGGQVLALKGELAQDEIKQIDRLTVACHALTQVGGLEQQTLLVMQAPK